MKSLLRLPAWIVCSAVFILQYILSSSLLSAYASRRGIGSLALALGVCIEVVAFPSQQILVPLYRHVYGASWHTHAGFSMMLFDAIVWAALIGVTFMFCRRHLTSTPNR
jgi:hypothetical protein